MGDVKSNRFLHKNQHTQRKFRYFVNQKNGELQSYLVELPGVELLHCASKFDDLHL